MNFRNLESEWEDKIVQIAEFTNEVFGQQRKSK